MRTRCILSIENIGAHINSIYTVYHSCYLKNEVTGTQIHWSNKLFCCQFRSFGKLYSRDARRKFHEMFGYLADVNLGLDSSGHIP